MHLIDTSVWVDFLRGRTNPKTVFLERLLKEGEAYLCEITYSEICFGAKDQRQFREYADRFSTLPFLSLPNNWHLRSAETGFKLRSKGYKPFVGDLLIAVTALHHDAILLTHDKDFEPYNEIFGLNLA